MNKGQLFDFLALSEQLKLIEKGSYIGSSKVAGVATSLFLAKGNLWIEVFYDLDAETINFLSVCPEIRLSLYVEGHDLADIL
ncbi:MAG: hypothetical protein ACJ77K_17595 [Bacteroidia bacterium]